MRANERGCNERLTLFDLSVNPKTRLNNVNFIYVQKASMVTAILSAVLVALAYSSALLIVAEAVRLVVTVIR